MPPSKRKTAAPAAEPLPTAVPAPAVEEPVGAVFTFEQVVNVPGADKENLGGGNAAVCAAQQAGHVVIGEATVSRIDELGGDDRLVVWTVPVKGA